MTQSSASREAASSNATVVLALLGDLMLSVRVEAIVRALGYRFHSVETLTELRSDLAIAPPAAVVFDLTAPAFPLTETLAAIRATGGRAPAVLGFFPHVLKEVGRAARDAGCTIVVPRSRFMTEMGALLQRAVNGVPLTAAEPEGDADA